MIVDNHQREPQFGKGRHFMRDTSLNTEFFFVVLTLGQTIPSFTPFSPEIASYSKQSLTSN